MASSSSVDIADSGSAPSAAQQLLQQHHAEHQPTVEDVPDEDLKIGKPSASGDGEAPTWAPTMSAKAAGKQKAQDTRAPIDTQSHEAFPELGGPKKTNAGVAPIWGAKGNANGKANGTDSADGTPRAATPGSGVATPTGSSRPGPPAMSIPGRNVESITLDQQHIMQRGALKRPIPDVIKDLNRKSRANISMNSLPGNRLRFEATGPQDVAQQALKDLVQQIGTKLSIKVPIPSSARAHIIGKGGATIKSIQEKTGARVQLPKVDESAPTAGDDDDDAMIDVIVEGNAHSAAAAREAINKIAGERSANVSTRLRGIPVEFYPFIGNPNSNFISNLENQGVQIRVPPHQYRSSTAPHIPQGSQRPVFAPPPVDENHIQLAGDRAAVQAAKAEIERRAQQLHQELHLEKFEIPQGRHQFIIGDRGVPAEEFFNDTGCTIILPTDVDDEFVTIIGPRAQLEQGKNRAEDLALNLQCNNIDISRLYGQSGSASAAHARDLTRYLRARDVMDRLEKDYKSYINTPFTRDGASPWELYSRDPKASLRARTEIKGITLSHPPSRIASLDVDPFFHQHLKTHVRPEVRKKHGVYIVVPEASEQGAPVLLVYEEAGDHDAPYQVPQTQPSQSDINMYQQSIRAAREHILDLIKQQEDIDVVTIDVPTKFHEKLRRFIKKEQENRSGNQIPIRVMQKGVTITLKGPKSAVQSLAAKVKAFVEQEKEDEKERGFTLSFDFPQNLANQLIGRGGSNIRDLRDKFDVEIQVQDGKVELKGPKAKAETAKQHILGLGRRWADETTHHLKIDPKFHRGLIGAQGSDINRLQDRYKVLIFFPRSAKPTKDDESSAEVASNAGKNARAQQAPDEVVIRGPKKSADEARDEIWKLYQYLKENSHTDTVTVQQKQLPYLIGQGGSAMEALRVQTGAKIDVPNDRNSADQMVEIQIRGTEAQVAAAKKAIQQQKVVFDDTVVQNIEVDRKYHRSLIGAGGSNIRDMVLKAGGTDDRRELSRAIQFPKQDSDGNTIKVEGRKSVVEKIVAQIQEFVSEREAQTTEVVDVPIEKHRTLIGRGGDIKRGIETDFKVSIDIPRQGSDNTGVKITGRPEAVEKAKERIVSLTKEKPGETVQVPRSLHHTISNNGQFFRKLKADLHVSVDHAGQAVPEKTTGSANARAEGGALPLITDEADDAPDAHSWKVVENASSEEGDIAWVLRGKQEDIEKAKKQLEAAIEQAKKSNATGYLVLADPKNHRHIIGAGGAKINAIRKQSGCNVQVPRGGSGDSDAIEVTGSKAGVEKAKDLILQAVREGAKGRD